MGVIREIACWFLYIYSFVLIARILLSWIPIRFLERIETLGGILYTLTDPVLRPLRRVLSPLRLGAIALDFVPAIAVVAIMFLRRIIC